MVKCIKSATALLRLAALHHFILHSTVKRPSEMFQTAFFICLQTKLFKNHINLKVKPIQKIALLRWLPCCTCVLPSARHLASL